MYYTSDAAISFRLCICSSEDAIFWKVQLVLKMYVCFERSPCKSSSIETALLIIGINDLVKSYLLKL